MINKLYYEMIKLYCEDPKRIQHFCKVHSYAKYFIAHHHTYDAIGGIDYQILVEADFLVNLYEDEASNQAIEHAYQKVFKTDSGKKIFREMFYGLAELDDV